MRVCDYLAAYPATDKLGHLFPGSWIQHNFGIWIGHPECNRAWDLLHQTRQFLAQAAAAKTHTAEQLAAGLAKRCYIAEGSDWFWWFGDATTSAQDELFDRLFRKHLQNVYIAAGRSAAGRAGQAHQPGQPPSAAAQPSPPGCCNVKVDGRRTYFEWINAGHYVCQRLARNDEHGRRRD